MQFVHRESAILAAIIEQYIHTGEPVPSGVVSHAFSLSPASIRNAMVTLAEKGYLEQPHISSGRVPTEKAFRRYIDTLLTPQALPESKKASLADALDAEQSEISHILRKASTLISDECSQLGVVLAPRRDDARWRSLEFSTVGPRVVLAVLVLDGGLVCTRLVTVTEDYSHDELARFSNYVNSHFKGLTLLEARRHILHELQGAGEHLEVMCRHALALSCMAVSTVENDREVFVDGASQVAHHVEFTDAKHLRTLLTLVHEKTRLLELLDRTMQSADLAVSFHTDDAGSMPWAVVSAPYGVSGSGAERSGVVSAMGPLRMDYAAVLPVVAYIARVVASVLQRRFADRP